MDTFTLKMKTLSSPVIFMAPPNLAALFNIIVELIVTAPNKYTAIKKKLMEYLCYVNSSQLGPSSEALLWRNWQSLIINVFGTTIITAPPFDALLLMKVEPTISNSVFC